MADITACNNEDCEKRMFCYRFTCKKNEFRQSYFSEDVRNGDGGCDYFWPNNMEQGKQ